MGVHAFPSCIEINFRHLQKNNKPASGLFFARLHYHNTYIERLCSCYGASPGTKYPQKLCLVIFFQMPYCLWTRFNIRGQTLMFVYKKLHTLILDEDESVQLFLHSYILDKLWICLPIQLLRSLQGF